MSTHLYRREEFQAFLAVSSIHVHFPNFPREARIRNGDLTLVWLDLANAYDSIPHQLISVALEHYHIPDQVQMLVKNYFGDIRLRFSSVENKTTRWQNVEKGIVTGCTISPILFVMGISLIIRAAEREIQGLHG